MTTMKPEDVRFVVHETLSGLGFTIDDPNQVQQDMIYLRKIRSGSEGIKKLIGGTFITVSITSFIYFIIESMKGVK